MRSTSWNRVYLTAGILGVLVGYIFTIVFRPSLLPPVLRFGIIIQPITVLFLGTDVVYTEGRKKRADKDAFTGRSDSIMVMRLDPYRDSVGVLQIPRDTQVTIAGYGNQKINAANALGGPHLAVSTVSQLLGLPIDHFVVLNVHGLVELVDELGGITVNVPKPMHYMDWTAKLKIDLEPGPHTLTGNQAMGFVRFRHDGLGDIGRVQRQEIFIRSVLDKAMHPEAWAHVPKLLEIARRYTYTDMDVGQLLQIASFVRAVPKRNQFLAMMPGSFSGTGDWLVDRNDARRMVARLTGSSFINSSRDNMHISIINLSSSSDMGMRLYRWLRNRGYASISVKNGLSELRPLKTTRIIAQRGNPEDAGMVQTDLADLGEVETASVGDLDSAVTIMAGDDLTPLVTNRPIDQKAQKGHRRLRNRS